MEADSDIKNIESIIHIFLLIYFLKSELTPLLTLKKKVNLFNLFVHVP